ncbi:hypothetical protein TRFO_06173 [Tritrichomonas foetus]|uniref:Uncharacterized protein n=1 Tax=Tritrichomonas foetus TaxID=1144522 RepID=A0A1J4K5J3_9EUKA|nr:hypothetical protein TRFO_06173 [Tritrichomonas foetus]|eukprot:OHT04741.1 hypothetical protein TRFO_06173 [Tritrichomonas foetus]
MTFYGEKVILSMFIFSFLKYLVLFFRRMIKKFSNSLDQPKEIDDPTIISNLNNPNCVNFNPSIIPKGALIKNQFVSTEFYLSEIEKLTNEYQNELQKIQIEKYDAENSLADLQKKCDQLHQQLSKYKGILEDEKIQHEKNIQILDKKLSDLNKQLEISENEKKELISQMNAEIDEKNIQIQNQEIEIQRLTDFEKKYRDALKRCRNYEQMQENLQQERDEATELLSLHVRMMKEQTDANLMRMRLFHQKELEALQNNGSDSENNDE